MKAALALGLSLTAAGIAGSMTSPAQAEAAAVAEKEYTKADVQAHKTKETGVWVTYQGGVYDITQFAENHPGRGRVGGGREGGWEGESYVGPPTAYLFAEAYTPYVHFLLTILEGGNKILMAAGGPVEPYWNLYAVHKDPEVCPPSLLPSFLATRVLIHTSLHHLFSLTLNRCRKPFRKFLGSSALAPSNTVPT